MHWSHKMSQIDTGGAYTTINNQSYCLHRNGKRQKQGAEPRTRKMMKNARLTFHQPLIIATQALSFRRNSGNPCGSGSSEQSSETHSAACNPINGPCLADVYASRYVVPRAANQNVQNTSKETWNILKYPEISWNYPLDELKSNVGLATAGLEPSLTRVAWTDHAIAAIWSIGSNIGTIQTRTTPPEPLGRRAWAFAWCAAATSAESACSHGELRSWYAQWRLSAPSPGSCHQRPCRYRAPPANCSTCDLSNLALPHSHQHLWSGLDHGSAFCVWTWLSGFARVSTPAWTGCLLTRLPLRTRESGQQCLPRRVWTVSP